MIISLVREPIILFETIAMICRYYRKESYSAAAERLTGLFSSGMKSSQIVELKLRGELADRLMNNICADIDVEDKDFQFFFKPFDTDDAAERNCVARVLIFSVMILEPLSFDDAIEQVKNGWAHVKRDGLELLHFHMHGINFMSANGRDLPSLFEQIYSMNYPYQAKMASFLALDRHEAYLSKLAEIVRPYAVRLEAALSGLAPVYASSADFWEFSLEVMSNEQIVALMRIEEKAKLTKLNKAYVSLFLFNEIGNSFDGHPSSSPDDITTLVVGMGIYPEYTLVLEGQRIDKFSEKLKALADPIRLEILVRLSKEPDYCLNLAQSMNMNVGNVSRTLTLLYENGFLKRTKKRGRLYFETDIEAIERASANLLSFIKY
ncbi:MAG: winged helix-turn-helix transcriptional regulator [Clostridia bacterium]|nr:winged helix-turn-helix transcriptional regulator [Clostridia bacterium]